MSNNRHNSYYNCNQPNYNMNNNNLNNLNKNQQMNYNQNENQIKLSIRELMIQIKERKSKLHQLQILYNEKENRLKIIDLNKIINDNQNKIEKLKKEKENLLLSIAKKNEYQRNILVQQSSYSQPESPRKQINTTQKPPYVQLQSQQQFPNKFHPQNFQQNTNTQITNTELFKREYTNQNSISVPTNPNQQSIYRYPPFPNYGNNWVQQNNPNLNKQFKNHVTTNQIHPNPLFQKPNEIIYYENRLKQLQYNLIVNSIYQKFKQLKTYNPKDYSEIRMKIISQSTNIDFGRFTEYYDLSNHIFAFVTSENYICIFIPNIALISIVGND